MARNQLTFNPEWDNVPVQKIGLKAWAEEHRLPMGATFVYNGQTCTIGKKSATERHFNEAQRDHLNSSQDFNIYEPVEAYSISWYHKGDKYYPIPDTAKRNDLPPVYIQWKDDYRKRNARIRRDRNRNIPTR